MPLHSSSSLAFLQTDPKEQARNMSGGKNVNTEVLRAMLLAQKKDSKNMKANSIFRDMLEKVHKKKGFNAYAPANTNPCVFVDDLETEGKMRTLEVISNSARRDGRQLHGVWATLGRPYVSLGHFSELEGSLPPLSRDSAPPAEPGLGAIPEVREALEPTSHAPGLVAGAAVVDDGDGKYRNMGLSDETIDKLLAHQCCLKFSTVDRIEAKFPTAALGQAHRRTRQARTETCAFCDEEEAESQWQDATASYGYLPPVYKPPVLNGRRTAPAKEVRTPQQGRGSAAAEESGATSDDGRSPGAAVAFSVPERTTSRMGRTGANLQRKPTMSMDRSAYCSSAGSCTGDDNVEECGAAAAEDSRPATDKQESGGRGPLLDSLTAPVRAPHDQSGNPIYRWHNEFLTIRHRAREQMQKVLWERAQGRRKARADPSLALGFYNALFSELAYGRPKFLKAGEAPRDIWAKAEVFSSMSGAQQARRRTAGPVVELEDVMLIERFYDQLCLLIEAQCPSDPVSLLIISEVKKLLEGGATLHKPLVKKVVECLASFVNGAGFRRYNRFLLPILTFLRKCCGMSGHSLEALLAAKGLMAVVFSPDTVPRLDSPLLPSPSGQPLTPGSGRPASTQKTARPESRQAETPLSGSLAPAASAANLLPGPAPPPDAQDIDSSTSAAPLASDGVCATRRGVDPIPEVSETSLSDAAAGTGAPSDPPPVLTEQPASC